MRHDSRDTSRSMYFLNFNLDYVVVLLVISAICYLKRDPFAYESTADVHPAT